MRRQSTNRQSGATGGDGAMRMWMDRAISAGRGVWFGVLVGCLLCWSIAVFVSVSASATGLPDGRVYEMVTPVENHDAEVYTPLVISKQLLLQGEADVTTRLPFQASMNGDVVTYVGESTVGGEGFDGSGVGNQYLATRAPAGGWRENGQATQVNLQPLGNQVAYYQAFSSDLSVGVLQDGEFGTPEAPLSPEAPTGEYVDLYTHATQNGSGGTYDPLLKSTPPNRSAEVFRSFDVPKTAGITNSLLSFAGSAGGVSLFEANDVLAPGAVDGGEKENNLYASDDGVLSVVNVLPGGGSEANATFGGVAESKPKGNPPDYSNVISSNGSRVYWTDLAPGTYENHIFLRENPSQSQSPLGPKDECLVASDACTVPVSAGAARYWTSAEEGRYAFYEENGELYRFDVLTGSREVLAGAAAEMQGVVGASEDGSYVYFVAHGVLSNGPDSQGKIATVDEDNLYVEHYDQASGAWEAPVFIATLSEQDDHEDQATGREVIPELGQETPKSEFGDWQPGLGHRTAEVSPDGRNLVFMSSNQDVDGYAPKVNGVPLEEVYIYSVEDGQLVCASCSPGRVPLEAGSEPAGGGGMHVVVKEGGGAALPPSFSSTYLPSWMSEDGDQVFFDSFEPLVSADTNGESDVYEWERDRSGSCEEAPGCVYLLSGGDSSSASWLAAEDPSGNDAFIVSRADLSPEDQGEGYSLFDARVNGLQPVAPPACTGTGCQGPPATAPTFATPASVTFTGVGNFPPPVEAAPTTKPKAKAKPTRCKKGFVRKKNKCVKKVKGKAKAKRSAKGRK